MSERIEPPIAPGKYKFGAPVTRANFIDMIKNSFAISRGASLVQQMYLEYLRRKDHLGEWDPQKLHKEKNYAIFSPTEIAPLHAAYILVNPPKGGHGVYLQPNESFFQACIEAIALYPVAHMETSKFDLADKDFTNYLVQLANTQRHMKAIYDDSYINGM